MRATDRFIEWCDYMPDARWRVFGWVLAPIMRACEWLNARTRA
jgi:hypothetical protein